ncbi:MAG TPA: hypothetical protein VHL57_00640, partial [Flavobacteriales bacterium]|nr:hypothetical protein [Flavobacteriales bacterium]
MNDPNSPAFYAWIERFMVKDTATIIEPHATYELIGDKGLDSVQFRGAWYDSAATSKLCEQLFSEAASHDKS